MAKPRKASLTRRAILAEARVVEKKIGWPKGTLSNPDGWPDGAIPLTKRQLAAREKQARLDDAKWKKDLAEMKVRWAREEEEGWKALGELALSTLASMPHSTPLEVGRAIEQALHEANLILVQERYNED